MAAFVFVGELIGRPEIPRKYINGRLAFAFAFAFDMVQPRSETPINSQLGPETGRKLAG
jgi:hypothetical protein